MTKKHFQAAAEIVANILQGYWTNVPTWATADDTFEGTLKGMPSNRLRAIQTAEAFIYLARQFNSRFDEQRFLVACSLAEPKPKAKARRK